ncbi:MAG: HEAT repeat domain-containing protein [Coleofasciculaceae cyanobacterium]
MINISEFQSYLQEICRYYEQWWTEVALTDTIANQLARFSFEQMVQTEEKEKTEEKPQKISLPIFQGIQTYLQSEHILLVGSPGVGKSTALLRCLISFASLELEKPEPRIPVLIKLKMYEVPPPNSEDPSGMLALIRAALKPQLRRLKLKIPEIPKVEELLFQKRLILLLDGLNEMPADTRRTKLQVFRDECKDSEIPLICTTREGGGTLGINRQLEIQPPSSLEIDRFLRECMPAQGQQVLQLLNRDNRELSRTPFVLWMLYQLFQEKGVVVETLGEAFRQFFQSFQKYKEDAPVSDERREDWNLWLECLAFTMLNSPPNESSLVISKERAEKVLAESERFGHLYGASSRIEELLKYHLLERVSDKEVSFHHQLIQEYYAAECLLPQLSELIKEQSGQKYTRFQIDYLNYLKWTEAIAIMLGLPEITENQAERLIKLALDVDLQLGARLAGEVKPDFQQKTVSMIAKQQVCKKLRSRLLGKTRSEAAVPLLIELLQDESSSVRSDVVYALGQIGGEAAISVLIEALNDDNYSVRSGVIDALDQIGGELVRPGLIKALEDEDKYLSRKALLLLAEIDLGDNFEILSNAILDPDTSLVAAIAITRIDSKKSAPVLLKAIKSSNFRVQFSAAFALGTMGFEIAVPVLQQAIEIIDLSDIHRMVIHLLARIDSEQAVSAMKKLIQDPNPDKSNLVINTLLSMDIEEIAPALRRVIQDPISEYKTSFDRKLNIVNTEEISDCLLQATQNIRPDVVKSAAFLLRKYGNPEMLSTLWQQQIRLFQEDIVETIASIQSRCQFYNYEIAQSSRPAAPKAEYSNSPQGFTIMTDKQPIINFNQSNATVGVNYAAENSNIKFQQNVKNISEQDLAEAAKKIQSLLSQLAQTYSHTTESQQQTFIQKFIAQLESTPDLIKVILAGGIEWLKILCPPTGIPIEMSRSLYEAVQKRDSQA